MSKLVLIDGNSLLFRAYFAMRDMVTKDGIHTQGAFAFINMLQKIMQDHAPDSMAVAFDMKGKTFRHDMYDDYKAGRMKTPVELLQQVPIMHRILQAMNIAVLELPTYEADDIIGTVSRDASEAGYDVLIITGDKDELQLIDENVRVMINRKGVTDFDLYDEAAMMERYGITPTQFIDLKGLMGDSSDNIPGIPGVGEKKGLQLLKQYGSVEGVIEHADEIPGKLGETVRNNLDSASMSKTLATIIRNAPIEYNLEDLKITEPNYDELIEIYKELEFNTFLKRLNEGHVQEEPPAAEPTDLSGVSVVKPEVFLSKVAVGSSVVIELINDNNHRGVPTASAVALYSPAAGLFASKDLTGFDAEPFLRDLCNRKYKWTGYSLKSAVYTLLSYGVQDFALAHDTEIAEYLLDPNRSKYELEKMALRHSNCVWTLPEGTEAQAMYRLFMIDSIAASQRAEMDRMGLSKLFDTCEMPLIETIAAMEAEGIRLDAEVLRKAGEELDQEINRLEQQIYDTAGQKFNINSPKQLGQVLFEDLGLPYPKTAKKNNGYSTAADILEKVAGESSIVRDVLEYRKYAKLKSTYVEGLLALVGEDGKIHPHFNQTVAATGRLSCTEPNLQNIPVRDEYGRSIRKAFTVDDSDRVFIGSDYSQIELRILAALSGDETLIRAFNEGQDIHRLTASRVFDIPFDKVTVLDRSRAKAVNFGVIYGMSGFGLSEELGISRADAQRYIDEYFAKHEAVKKFLDEQIKKGEVDREVRTLFGRVRQIPEFASRKYMDRQLANRLAMNTPIQGTAADIIKMAMNKVYYELKDRGLKSKLVLQIHDELIIEAYKDEAEVVSELLLRDMQDAVKLDVELVCDMHSADTWYDLK
ncbi:MAG: DNA polymerase I [Mogibacterium sp.]|nr:DNA polymerase I [Mogibacterium sp.]